MLPLEEKYYERLNEIAANIQESPNLASYLDEEEDEYYNELRSEFEPQIAELHHLVAEQAPLQMVTLEKYLLDDNFEGLFLPRVLGYAVLRGEINSQYLYVRPNDHFKEVLMAICVSPHFEQLRKRIGQTIQVGFALSSDIWITNLLSQIENKRIRNFLLQQKSDKFRDPHERESIYQRYSRQFRGEFYYSAEFPTGLGEMKANFSALRLFLLKKFETGGDYASLKEQIQTFLANKEFYLTEEYMEMLAMYGNFISLSDEEKTVFKEQFERERGKLPEFDEKYLRFLLALYRGNLNMSAEHDERMGSLVSKTKKDKISDYYRMADKIHGLGYVHPDVMDGVQEFCNTHEGLSIESDCVRQIILNYFRKLINGLTVREYPDYFELTKIFGIYIRIFSNEQFNLEVERYSMEYIHKLLKTYTDKRGKDYQDIKKFVSTQFVDLGFLKEKEVTEMFKTRRKKKTAETE